MRNIALYHDAFDSSVANCTELNSSVGTMDDPASNDLLNIAAQLVEAAHKARIGDREATRVHIAHAVALLRGKPSLAPSGINVLRNLETQVARGGLPAWQMRRVFTHVEANVGRRILVRELARLLDLSASHFCRAFKCTFRVSPRDYVLRRRIEVAQGLMLTTPEPLSSIAAKCGMCDQQHFTRSFRRIVGESPSRWRRSRQDTMNTDSLSHMDDAGIDIAIASISTPGVHMHDDAPPPRNLARRIVTTAVQKKLRGISHDTPIAARIKKVSC